MDYRTLLRWLFNPWIIGGAIFIALLLLAATMAIVWLTRPGPAPVAQATAVLNVVQAPTSTPFVPTATPLILPTETPSLPEGSLPPSPLPGSIAVDMFVQISNTGGDGLRLRTDPGLNGEVRLLGAEAEVFRVAEGPQDIDGFTWWYLVGPYDESRRGWAVANYLTVVQGPQ